MRDVYAIYESRSEGRERSRWVRVGVAFDNRDGSVNVLLDALPLSGRLQIRSRPNESSADSRDPRAKSPAAAAAGESQATTPDGSAETRIAGG